MKIARRLWVVFNELYYEFLDSWRSELLEPDFYNVVLDMHLYDWQLPYTYETREEHLRDAVGWRDLIATHSRLYAVMVGEWCMSTGTAMQVG